MKLSADHMIDGVEKAWGLEMRAARYSVSALAQASGRTVGQWFLSFAVDDRPTPAEVAAERAAIIRKAWLDGFTCFEVARLARAPRAFCAAYARTLPEFTQ